MYLDEITPGDSEVEFTNELTSIVDRLRLGAISKEEASNMIADFLTTSVLWDAIVNTNNSASSNACAVAVCAARHAVWRAA